jgi:hypothetical protein
MANARGAIMSCRTVNIYTVKERLPEDGETIILLSEGLYGTSIKVDKVERSWLEVGEDGYDTGDQLFYNPKANKTPQNCRLVALINGFELSDEDEYAIAEEFVGGK